MKQMGQEDLKEKRVAPQSSILAWRITWTEEPGRLQSTEWWRVRHDWSDLARIPGGPVVKNPPANAGDTCSIPGLGRSYMWGGTETRGLQLLPACYFGNAYWRLQAMRLGQEVEITKENYHLQCCQTEEIIAIRGKLKWLGGVLPNIQNQLHLI